LATRRAVLQPHTEAHMPGSNSSIFPAPRSPEVGSQHSLRYKDGTLGFSFAHPEIVFSDPDSKHYAAQQWERATAAKIAIGSLDGVPN
jgi:hypothetical protein